MNIGQGQQYGDIILHKSSYDFWWTLNISTQQHEFSPDLASICGLGGSVIKKNDFMLMVKPDHKSEVENYFSQYARTDIDNEEFELLTKFGYRWASLHTESLATNSQGATIVLGSLRFLSEKELPQELVMGTDIRVNNLVERYSSMSLLLTELLDTKDLSVVVEKVLGSLLTEFGGDRTYLFEYDHKKQTQSCTYEFVDSFVKPAKENLQNIPMQDMAWWTEKLYHRKESIVCDDIIELPFEAESERELLEQQGIVSIMAAPLISRGGIGGYIGVDVVGKKRHWSAMDKTWFQSLANMISVCLELKKSEEKALHRKEYYQSLYENLPVGFIRLKLVFDKNKNLVDYKYLEINSQADKIINVDRSALLDKLGSTIALPDGAFQTQIKRLAQVNKTQTVFREKMPNGEFNSSLEYTLYPAGEKEIIALIQDTTESEKISRALRKSEETLENIYKNIPVGIEIYDRDGQLISINDIEQEIFGFDSKEDVLGINLFENPNVPDYFLEDLKNKKPSWCDFYYDFGRLDQYYKSRCEEKKHIVLKGTVLCDSDGNVENYLLVVLDNTDTLQANHKIREFENLFNSIAEFSELGLTQWNPYEKTIFSTDQWYDNLGVQKDKIKDVMDAYANARVDDRRRVKKAFENMALGYISSYRDEISVFDGERWKWLRISYKVSEYSPQDRNIEIIGINIDITELKNTEFKLLRAKHKAEESDRLKSAFLANMSHEIRTPLNSIVGFSDLLVGAQTAEEKELYIKIIRQNNDLLLQLISDILDLSKIESGMVDVSLELVDINVVCEEIVFSLGRKAHPGVEVCFEDHLDRCLILSDRKRLSQVLINLVGNAIKFTSKGKISIGYHLEDKNVKFYVRDTGIGLAEEQLPNIFSRFVKYNDFIPGTGLGLSICKSLVEKLGGTISLESELGVGTCFYFTHPYSDKVNESSMEDIGNNIHNEEKSLSDNQIALKPLILVAEDNESNYMLVSTILKKEYTLIRAVNGLEAVELYDSYKPDLILMDVRMPQMDGLTATEKIKEKDPNVPIIVLTAFAYNEDRIRADKAGCDGFISKPVTHRELKEVIRKHINR